jgi:sarcosine oxidase, subunit delta
MLLITCPWCGAREESEFAPGGEAHIQRPDPHTASDRDWAEYMYYRTNPKGLHVERWLHALGCRRWFNVARDTVTHEIRAVYKMGEKRPEGL